MGACTAPWRRVAMTSTVLQATPTAAAPLGLRASALAGVPLPLLAGSLAQGDTSLGGPPRYEGHCGPVRWQHDGQWLLAALDLHAQAGLPLADQVQQGYLDLFRTLHETGFTHPLRLWNYLPQINAELDGLERYRHFNLGRQQAFIQAGQAAFEGAPAACALGTHGEALCIRVLAGRGPVLPLENPRQVSAYRYPSDYGPRAPTFSRAALADVGAGQLLLLISGTASIVGHATLHAGDPAAQLNETLNNLQALVDVASARGSARFTLPGLHCTVYLRHPEHLALVRQGLQQRLGPEAALLRNAVYLQADICRRDLLVEIEAHAMAPGALTT
jgi:enamine deaminase RidA (YjgF/YER057c/UK114 family)